MNDREKIDKFKSKIKQLRGAYDKAKGANEADMSRLKSKFGAVSIEQAEAMLADSKSKKKKLDKEIEEKKVAFERKYKI